MTKYFLPLIALFALALALGCNESDAPASGYYVDRTGGDTTPTHQGHADDHHHHGDGDFDHTHNPDGSVVDIDNGGGRDSNPPPTSNPEPYGPDCLPVNVQILTSPQVHFGYGFADSPTLERASPQDGSYSTYTTVCNVGLLFHFINQTNSTQNVAITALDRSRPLAIYADRYGSCAWTSDTADFLLRLQPYETLYVEVVPTDSIEWFNFPWWFEMANGGDIVYYEVGSNGRHACYGD